MATLTFWEFVRERHSIYLRRQRGEPPPWTADPVLAGYHFTNVYRELDPGTVFIREQLRQHALASLEEKILNVAMYRLCLHEQSFAALGWQALDGFDGAAWGARIKQLERPFHGAFYIHNLGLKIPKAEAMGIVADFLLAHIYGKGINVGSRRGFIHSLAQVKGIGGFIATQVLADLCYDQHVPLPEDGYVALGPGALKGLALVFGEEADPQQALETAWECQPEWLRAAEGFRPLTRMNLQNCFCEFSKYNGHPRRRFSAAERVAKQGELL